MLGSVRAALGNQRRYSTTKTAFQPLRASWASYLSLSVPSIEAVQRGIKCFWLLKWYDVFAVWYTA